MPLKAMGILRYDDALVLSRVAEDVTMLGSQTAFDPIDLLAEQLPIHDHANVGLSQALLARGRRSPLDGSQTVKSCTTRVSVAYSPFPFFSGTRIHRNGALPA